jgi:putative hemolysin
MIKNRSLVILQDLVRIPYFVPETKKSGELLKEFKRGKIHMAIIVDEFGGTSGLVTLEDIIEKIVGDIQDEYDVLDKKVEFVEKGTYIVDGDMEIEKLISNYKMDIPREDDINTIGGFVSAICGRVPKEGEHYRFGKIFFTVLKADEKRIIKLKIEMKNENSSGGNQCEPGNKT